MMEIDYRRDMNHNYMIVKGTGHDMPEDYETKVISTNRIPGLLVCHTQYIDSEIWYSYDVTSLQKLTVFCESRRIGKAELTGILAGVLGVLEGLEDYLLDFQHLVLTPSCVCIDFDTMKIYLMYVPFYRKDIRRSLRELTEYLLGCADHSDQSAIVLGYRFYHEVQENNTQLGDLMGVLYSVGAASRAEPGESGGRSLPYGIGTDISGDTGGGTDYAYVSRPAIQPPLPNSEHTDAGEDVQGMCAGDSKTGKADRSGKKKSFPGKKAVIAVLSGLIVLAAIYILRYTNFPAYVSIYTLLGIAAALCAAALALYLIKNKRKDGQDKTERDMSLRRGDAENFRDIRRDNEEYDAGSGVWDDPRADECVKPRSGKEPYDGEGSWQSLRDGEGFGPAPDVSAEAQMTTLLSSYRPVSGPEDRWLLPVSDGYASFHLCGEDLLIGKHGQHVDMVIDDSAVSRIHAKLIFRAGRYFIRDLSSRNGTYVNDEALCGEDERMLKEGDVITFADVRYMFSQTKEGARCENADEGV